MAEATRQASFGRELFYNLGVDGVFSDNPDTAVAVRSKLSASS